MLQIKNYPALLGQSLFLEPEPFVEMVDDDNPWIEGLFFTILLGLLLALSRVIGGLLTTASLPDSTALLETLLIAIQQARPFGLSAVGLDLFQEQVRAWWPWITGLYNYGIGWVQLLFFVLVPLSLVAQWMLYGLIAYLVARVLGGTGSLGQTLGIAALALSPRIILTLMVIPFFSVNALLFHVWGILLAYRGLEVAHDLPVNRAAIAAVAPAVVGVLLLISTVLFSTFSMNWVSMNWVSMNWVFSSWIGAGL